MFFLNKYTLVFVAQSPNFYFFSMQCHQKLYEKYDSYFHMKSVWLIFNEPFWRQSSIQIQCNNHHLSIDCHSQWFPLWTITIKLLDFVDYFDFGSGTGTVWVAILMTWMRSEGIVYLSFVEIGSIDLVYQICQNYLTIYLFICQVKISTGDATKGVDFILLQENMPKIKLWLT